MLAPALWTPLLVVGLEGAFGVNAYSALGAGWLAVNAIFGLAVIPVMVWVSRRYADRMAQSPFVHRLMNDIAGHSLTAATAFLEQLVSFEREDRPRGLECQRGVSSSPSAEWRSGARSRA